MQHSERNNGRKFAVGKGHCSGVARDHVNIGVDKPRPQGGGGIRIEFESGQSPRETVQQICRQTGTRSEFKDILSEVASTEDPRHSLLKSFSPVP